MGYPNPSESPFDLFMTGHAGCAPSTALRLKVGDELSVPTIDMQLLLSAMVLCPRELFLKH